MPGNGSPTTVVPDRNARLALAMDDYPTLTPPAGPSTTAPATHASRLLANEMPAQAVAPVAAMGPFLGDWYSDLEGTLQANPHLAADARDLLAQDFSRNPVHLLIRDGHFSSLSRVRRVVDDYEVVSARKNEVMLALKSAPGSPEAAQDPGIRHAHLLLKGDTLWIVSGPINVVLTRTPNAPVAPK